MKKRLIMLLAFALVFIQTGLIGAQTAVQTTSAEPKATMTKVTLFAGSESFVINLENTTPEDVITYKSGDEKIAAVSSTGVVTPVRKGTVKITVEISRGENNFITIVTVNVEEPSIVLFNKCEILNVGQSFKFQAVGHGLKTTNFVYSVSDTKLAAINPKSGELKALASGTVTVSVKDTISGKTSTSKLTIQSGANKDAAAPAEKEDPIARLTRSGGYAYFGNYPQTEIKGTALTAKIINAKYTNGRATVDGAKYLRITYNQITNFENKEWKGYRYFKIDPIKWRILSSSDKELFLIAENALDCAVYNDVKGTKNITWENSTLRGWLNLNKGHFMGKEGFMAAAFTTAEQNAILKKTIKNSKNSSYGTDGGKDTLDKVFLLSIEEASTKAYGFSTDKMTKDTKRIAYATEYAKVMGAQSDEKGAVWWTLRSPGSESASCAIVYGGGRIETAGMQTNDHTLAIRPAIRVDLKSVVAK